MYFTANKIVFILFKSWYQNSICWQQEQEHKINDIKMKIGGVDFVLFSSIQLIF